MHKSIRALISIMALTMVLFQNCNKESTEIIEYPTKSTQLPEKEKVYSTTRAALHTLVTVSIYGDHQQQIEKDIESIFKELNRLGGMLTHYNPNSPISAINNNAGQAAVTVPSEVIEIVSLAKQISNKTKGAFDISCGPVVDLWDFNKKTPEIPTQFQILKSQKLIGYDKIIVNPEQQTVQLLKPGMKIAVGGISKGFIVDKAVHILKDKGYKNFLISAGGELFAAGTKGGKQWVVGIKHPKGNNLIRSFAITEEAIATSGNYERYFMINNQRFHHIINPATGWPTKGVSSVTVMAPSVALADAYATAFFVLGIQEAIKIASKLPHIEVVLIDDDFHLHGTSSFMNRLQKIQ